MRQRRRSAFGPIIFPAVVLVVMVILAVVIRDGVWMTAALVVGLAALGFLIAGVATRLPTRRD